MKTGQYAWPRFRGPSYCVLRRRPDVIEQLGQSSAGLGKLLALYRLLDRVITSGKLDGPMTAGPGKRKSVKCVPRHGDGIARPDRRPTFDRSRRRRNVSKLSQDR